MGASITSEIFYDPYDVKLNEDPYPLFRRLREEHRHHEERLHELAEKSRLSEDEEMEEKRLKKEKLLLKDRMEAISRHRREEVPS